MVEKDENRLRVTLRTMVNGYMLEVNDEGYMYFDDQSLLEGFCIHVGMNRLEAMTMEEIRDMLSAFRDGGIVKKLQAEITQLKVERAELKKKFKNLKMQKCNNEII